jgi:hypothetical protein
VTDEPCTSHMIDLDQSLIDAAKPKPETTYRTAIDQSVRELLPEVVELSLRAGLTARPTGKRKPRMISDSTWELLGAAEEKVSLSRVELIRAALVLRARHLGHGGKRG